jgi:uncharacterized membrane protein YeiB
MITVLDLRVYPLFAFLFGYGMMQLFLRQTAAGTSEREGVALLGSATMAAFAVGVWLATVVGADAMERAGRRGPAEVLLRRLTYGTAAHTAPVEPTRQGR